MQVINLILDLILVGAAIWMVYTVRGIGGIVGKTLNIITVGAIVLGLAHITDTGLSYFWPGLEGVIRQFIHRMMVFTGFVLLALGFRQIRELK